MQEKTSFDLGFWMRIYRFRVQNLQSAIPKLNIFNGRFYALILLLIYFWNDFQLRLSITRNMTRWQLLTDEAARQGWDDNLFRFADCSPFQTFSWGQYNRTLGWQPYYFAAFDEKDEINAMCLGLLRRYPFGVGLMWCVGGLVGDIHAWDENLRKTILESTGLKHLYFRFRCDRERDIKDVLFLNNASWTRTSFMMTSGMSMEFDLSKTEDELLAGLSRRWNRNLKAARKNKLIIKKCLNPNIEEICRVYSEMEANKNLPQLFSQEKLENLFKYSADNLIFYRCEDEEGRLLCFRGCLIVGRRATDYLAAADEQGRMMRASYATLWELLLECKKQGVTSYDLGGIDPWANPGVYTFKKETGARETEALGEWDWATSEALRMLGNWAIQRRQKSKSIMTKSTLFSNFRLPERLGKALGRKKNAPLKSGNHSLNKNPQLSNES
jgi:hypothetical protein